ncbi:MAG: hypothetical protein NUK63_05465 [Candidatus Bathyarchaeum tardum]|nr:MAG: hypothetical protein NUK63_05465 [Candidatus Bathyarchaeum tardum]
MQCIFFRNDICYANPQIPALLGKYQPEKQVIDKYCKTENFPCCPRLKATLEYFKAVNGE